MDYTAVREAATKLGISERRVQKLCKENHINVQLGMGHMWLILNDAPKSAGLRKSRKQGGQ